LLVIIPSRQALVQCRLEQSNLVAFKQLNSVVPLFPIHAQRRAELFVAVELASERLSHSVLIVQSREGQEFGDCRRDSECHRTGRGSSAPMTAAEWEVMRRHPGPFQRTGTGHDLERLRTAAGDLHNPILGARQHPAVWTGRLPGASSPVRWVTGEAIACPSVTGEKMASSSHNGKNARTSATAAGSSDAGQDQTGEFLTTAQGLRLPDIEVTNDPLLQARLFSYLDTQLTCLGGPNFTQLAAAVGLHRAWDRAPAVMASAVPPVHTS
jgi:hypothetical protein